MSYLETARRALEAFRAQKGLLEKSTYGNTVETVETPPIILPFARPAEPAEPLDPAPPRRIWTPQARLVDDARRLGVRLDVVDGKLQVTRPAGLGDYEWIALNFGLDEFQAEVIAELGSQCVPNWHDLAKQRWGPALEDDSPGIIIDQPDPVRRMAALEAVLVEGERGEADETGLDDSTAGFDPADFLDIVQEVGSYETNEVAPVPDLAPVDFTADDCPAWVDDPTASVSLEDVRASIAWQAATEKAEQPRPKPPKKPTRSKRRRAPVTTPSLDLDPVETTS